MSDLSQWLRSLFGGQQTAKTLRVGTLVADEIVLLGPPDAQGNRHEMLRLASDANGPFAYQTSDRDSVPQGSVWRRAADGTQFFSMRSKDPQKPEYKLTQDKDGILTELYADKDGAVVFTVADYRYLKGLVPAKHPTPSP